ncbi:MAG: hypothetical protein U0575_00625 [Phycisphaerales bacterium]
MPVLGTTQLLRWSCPVNLAASPPQPDTDGSRLLVHVQDAAGNDFEIRCVRGALSHWYEYRISFPDGTSKELSTCIYSLGLNDVSLVYQGAMSETTAPNGTPVINVGAIHVVEHSNIEGTGSALTGITPKPGGKDFHVVYDYRQKLRYRLNTIVGQGVTGTDLLSTRAPAPSHLIMHADVVAIASRSDFAQAMKGDTAFRQLNDRDAKAPVDDFEFQDAHTDDAPIGYVHLDPESGGKGATRQGGILLDPSLAGSTFSLRPRGLEADVPAQRGRTRSTFALERRLLRTRGERLAVKVDGKARKAIVRHGETMVVLELALNAAAHRVSITEGRARA